MFFRKGRRAMFSDKTYKDVVGMAAGVTGDERFVEDLAAHVEAGRLVRGLFAARCAAGLSQADVAERMGCTQSRVSKLEAAADDDLSLGDLRSYAKALGLALTVTLGSTREGG